MTIFKRVGVGECAEWYKKAQKEVSSRYYEDRQDEAPLFRTTALYPHMDSQASITNGHIWKVERE